MERFKGIIPALYTPFNREGNLDIDAARRLINFLHNAGCTGLFVGGSSGEGFYQDTEERKRFAELVVSEARGEMDVVIHVGAMDLRQAVEMAKYAKSIKASGISSVVPFYYPYTFNEIKAYYEALNSASDLPLLIYYFPSTGSVITAKKFVETFGDLPNLWGVKYTGTDLYEMQLMSIYFDREIHLFGGYDQMALCNLVMGSRGLIGNNFNHIPEPYIKIYNAFIRGELKKAVEFQREANGLLSRLKVFGLVNVGKAVLKLRGIDVGNPRLPMLPCGSNEIEEIRKILSEYKLI